MSERAKRKRSVRTQEPPTECIQCAVCLSEFTVTDVTSSFDCTHQFCTTSSKKCDKELFERSTDRCPQCRKPRVDTQRSRTEIAKRRDRAREQSADEGPGFIFFPIMPPTLLQNGENTSNVQSVEESFEALEALASNPILNHALGMPLGSTALPMAEFFRHTARLRAQANGSVSVTFTM